LRELQTMPIARDGLAIIVHPTNRVDNLTLRDLRRLYSGRIFNWVDVEGAVGPDLAVQVVMREGESGTGAIFQERILGEERMTPNARIFPNGLAVVNFVAQHPEAVGFVSQALMSDKVKIVTVEEIPLNRETVANAAYPLTYLVYLALPVSPDPTVEAFADFVLRPSGQSILAGAGFGRLH